MTKGSPSVSLCGVFPEEVNLRFSAGHGTLGTALIETLSGNMGHTSLPARGCPGSYFLHEGISRASLHRGVEIPSLLLTGVIGGTIRGKAGSRLKHLALLGTDSCRNGLV